MGPYKNTSLEFIFCLLINGSFVALFVGPHVKNNKLFDLFQKMLRFWRKLGSSWGTCSTRQTPGQERHVEGADACYVSQRERKEKKTAKTAIRETVSTRHTA